MNVLFVSPEVSPFAKTGGLGDVSEALPILLNELGVTCSVIMPFYRLVQTHGFKPSFVKRQIPITIGKKRLNFDLSVIEYKHTNFYFIHNDDLYDREWLYGTPKGDYEDNALRFGFFSRAVLESIPYIGRPDVINCNDWQCGLIPLYLKSIFKDNPDFNKIKVLFTIHNLAYQGLFPKDAKELLDIPDSFFTKSGVEFYGKVSLIKAGIVYSNAISTVSEGYAREMLTKEFGCGLDDILKTRQKHLYGILNGADYDTWNPETDKFIVKNYSRDNLAPKLECKEELVREFDIPFNKDIPLIGMITRLAQQKGIDLAVGSMDELLDLGVNFVILGTGEERYNRLCGDLAKRHKGKAAGRVAFDNPLAHKIEAGCDMFLMPSRYEPCGLNQMYSLKYATVPIVRATGGLEDTIEDFDWHTKKGNGFKFKRARKEDMLEAVKRSVEIFKDKAAWNILQQNGLECDFSWKASARHYLDLYKSI